MRRITLQAVALFLVLLPAAAQTPELSTTVKPFVRVNAAKVVLTHVRVVDGTGAPAVEDENVVIQAGKIVAVGKGTDASAGPGTAVLDLHGYTVIPGLVGMHNHLFYIARPNLNSQWKHDEPLLGPQMTCSAPRVYVAGGAPPMPPP